MSFVRWIADCLDAPLDSVGGRAKGFGELVKGDYPVPDGFVIETSAYRSAVIDSGLLDDISAVIASGDQVKDAAAMSSAIAQIFERFDMPSDVHDQIVSSAGPVANSTRRRRGLRPCGVGGPMLTRSSSLSRRIRSQLIGRPWGRIGTSFTARELPICTGGRFSLDLRPASGSR